MRTSIQPCRLGSLTRPTGPFRRPAQRPVAKAVPPTSTSTSTAHVASLESLVKAADADGDGKLTVQEVLALLQQQQVSRVRWCLYRVGALCMGNCSEAADEYNCMWMTNFLCMTCRQHLPLLCQQWPSHLHDP